MLQTYNVVYPAPGNVVSVTLVNPKSSSLKLFASSTFSLKVIGIGSILFGCADLVAGFMAFSYQWLWAWLFAYAWAGFLFAVVSGSLVLKAATVKPHVDKHWTNVAFIFGIATLVLHVVDVVIVAKSVFDLALIGTFELYREFLYEDPAWLEAYNYYIYYYYQSPLVAEAPRLVIVSVLLALDIWLIIVTTKLREHFRLDSLKSTAVIFLASPNASPSSGALNPANAFSANAAEFSANNLDETIKKQRTPALQTGNAKEEQELQLLAKARQALIASGIFSLIYGAAELAAGVCSIFAWLWIYSYFFWFAEGFTSASFVLAAANGALALRAAYKKPNAGKVWSKVVFIVGVVALVGHLIAAGFCVYGFIKTGQVGPTYYATVRGNRTGTVGSPNYWYYVYVRAVTPAVSEAARLVALFVLICATAVQVFYAFKLKKLFEFNPTITLTPTASPVSAYPVPSMPANAAYPSQANTDHDHHYAASPVRTWGHIVTPVYPESQQIADSNL